MITFILVVIGALIMIGPLVYILDYESNYTHTITVEPKVPKLVTEKKSDSMVMDTDISILEVINQIELELEEEENPKVIEPKALPQQITYIAEHEVVVVYELGSLDRDFICQDCGHLDYYGYYTHRKLYGS